MSGITFGDDWPRLIRLRERRLEQAREAVAQQRRGVQAAASAVGQAQAALHARTVQALAHRAAQREQASRGGVAAMREHGAFAQVLDARVGVARGGVGQAQAALAKCEAQLQDRLAAWRHATAELHAATELHARDRRAAARLAEQRRDDRLDDASRERWLLACAAAARA